jgi:hypothetical protein
MTTRELSLLSKKDHDNLMNLSHVEKWDMNQQAYVNHFISEGFATALEKVYRASTCRQAWVDAQRAWQVAHTHGKHKDKEKENNQTSASSSTSNNNNNNNNNNNSASAKAGGNTKDNNKLEMRPPSKIAEQAHQRLGKALEEGKSGSGSGLMASQTITNALTHMAFFGVMGAGYSLLKGITQSHGISAHTSFITDGIHCQPVLIRVFKHFEMYHKFRKESFEIALKCSRALGRLQILLYEGIIKPNIVYSEMCNSWILTIVEQLDLLRLSVLRVSPSSAAAMTIDIKNLKGALAKMKSAIDIKCVRPFLHSGYDT